MVANHASRTGLFLAALLAIGAASPAAAVTYAKSITQTLTYTTSFTTSTQYNNNPTNTITGITPASFTISKFNPVGSKGQTLTLTGITISYTSQLGGTVTLINGSANARVGNLQYEIANSLTIGPVGTPVQTLTSTVGAGILTPFNIPRQSQGNIGIGGANTFVSSSFSPTNLTPYIGTGSLTVTQGVANFFSDVILNSGGKGNLRGTANANINGAFTITYNYLDPLPEPQSWAMMIAGMGITGLIVRRRRNRTGLWA